MVQRPLLRFVLRRMVAAIVLVFIAASAALLLANSAPGDYTTGKIDLPPDVAAAERQRLGLDRPFAEQYWIWLRRALTLDLGESFRYHRPVVELVRERGANTAFLAVVALTLATIVGIPVGVLTGSRRRGPLIVILRAASALCLSMPPLITSLLLLLVAAHTGLFPVGGLDAPDPGTPWTSIVSSAARHVALPALALALPFAAMLERVQAQALAEALAQPMTTAALARGIPRRRIVAVHAWRLSLGPLLAVYTVVVGALFSGSFAVEIVAVWPGLGRLMIDAIMARDTYLVAGCATAGAVFVAIAVFLGDVAHAAVDPRLETFRS
jgi:peptide/nickel transport system permease protein